jgi:hypothetical protein
MEHDASSDCEPNASQSDLTLADEVPAPVHVHTHKCGSLAHTHNAMELGIDIPPRGYQQVHKDMEHDDASEFDPGPSSRGVLQVDEPVAHDKLTHVHVLTHSLKMKVQADAMRCMQVCNCWDRLQGKEHLHRYRCRDTNIISFGMGIIHGLAGPGGVMGKPFALRAVHCTFAWAACEISHRVFRITRFPCTMEALFESRPLYILTVNSQAFYLLLKFTFGLKVSHTSPALSSSRRLRWGVLRPRLERSHRTCQIRSKWVLF